MLKIFPIDFVRQALEQKLLEEHNKNLDYFGGPDQVNIFSFYEQLKSQSEVDRFVENFRELTEQQNRMGLILNGVLVSPENPPITNLYSSLIVPITWSCSMRCRVENRDDAMWTLNNLIDNLRGRKCDIAQLECIDDNGGKCYKPFMVGTIGQRDIDSVSAGELDFKNGDYLGEITTSDLSYGVHKKIVDLSEQGVEINAVSTKYGYIKYENKLTAISFKRQTINSYRSADIGTPVVDDTKSIRFTLTLDGYVLQSEINSIVADIKLAASTENVPYVWATVENVSGIVESVSHVGNTTQAVVKFTCEEDLSSYFTTPEPIIEVRSGTIEEANVNTTTIVAEICEPTETNIIIPPEHTSFEKYKLSMSFETIRCDEPRNLNAGEYCELTFSGSATLVSQNVQLGNDLLKIAILKKRIEAETTITFSGEDIYYLEPLEMPSGNNANTQINQLVSNNFLSKTHTDAIAISLQYTFIADFSKDLIKQLFDYARYGTRGITEDDISPNMIFEIRECWCSWGEFEMQKFEAKIVENIDIENTESDTLTLSVSFQIQGGVS